MQYSLGLQNQLNNYIKPSSSRRESIYSIKSTDQLQKYFAKLREENQSKICELEQRLEQCLNLNYKIDMPRPVESERTRRQGLNLNLQRYEDLLQCNFKQIQWVRSSRMSEDGEGEKLRKVDTIQGQVYQFQELILQRQAQQQKNLGELELRITQELQHIKQSFEESSIKQQNDSQKQFSELSILEKQFTQNILELQQSLKLWRTSAGKLLQGKIQQIQSQLLTFNPKK